MKKSIKKTVPILSIVAFVFGVAAILLCLCPGYKITLLSKEFSYSLFELMFGCDATAKNGENVANAGLIIALVLIVIGLLASAFEVCGSMQKKANKGLLTLVGLIGICGYVVGGILFCCTISLTGLELADPSVVNGYVISAASAGVGVYLTAIASFIGAVCLLIPTLKPVLSKRK